MFYQSNAIIPVQHFLFLSYFSEKNDAETYLNPPLTDEIHCVVSFNSESNICVSKLRCVPNDSA